MVWYGLVLYGFVWFDMIWLERTQVGQLSNLRSFQGEGGGVKELNPPPCVK